MPRFLAVSDLKMRKLLRSILEKSILNFSDSYYPSNPRKSTIKNIEATFLFIFLQDIPFHTQRKDEGNIFRKIYPQLTIRGIIQEIGAKKSGGNTLVCRFLQGIWFHTQRKEGANTFSIRSSQRNCWGFNDGLHRHKSNDLCSTQAWNQWCYWLLWQCCWNHAKRNMGTISVHNLSRSPTINDNRSNEIKWFHTKNASSRQYPAKIISDAA